MDVEGVDNGRGGSGGCRAGGMGSVVSSCTARSTKWPVFTSPFTSPPTSTSRSTGTTRTSGYSSASGVGDFCIGEAESCLLSEAVDRLGFLANFVGTLGPAQSHPPIAQRSHEPEVVHVSSHFFPRLRWSQLAWVRVVYRVRTDPLVLIHSLLTVYMSHLIFMIRITTRQDTAHSARVLGLPGQPLTSRL